MTWVDAKPVGDLTHVTFFTQWLDAKNPDQLHKKFEMFLPSHAVLNILDELNQSK